MTNVLMPTPGRLGKCLRCGATGHDLASCRRPARRIQRQKVHLLHQRDKEEEKAKAKAKPKPKAKAQAHESTAQPAGANAAWALEDDAGHLEMFMRN